MSDTPIITTFSQLAPLIIQQYENYLPSAFSEELTLLQKVNKIINYLNVNNGPLNGIIEQWNDQIVPYVNGDSFQTDINNKLDLMSSDGTLASLISVDVLGDLSTLKTVNKNSVVGAINSNAVQLFSMGVNSSYPPIPLVGLKGDGSDETQTFQNLLNYCRDNNVDLILNGLNTIYKLNNGITWDYMHHSIKTFGNVVLDFSGMTSGVAVTVKGDPSSSGLIWESITHTLSNIKFLGNVNIDFMSIGEVANGGTSAPCVNIENCYIDTFNNGINLGNENWSHEFKRVFFRNIKHAVVVNTVTDSGENIRFISCIFSGCTDYAILHQSGTVELTFDGCSFDYNKGVLNAVNVGSRGTYRFHECHFEDDGSVTAFNISKVGSEGYYLKLNVCDWYYTTVFPSHIGSFSGDKINVSVIDGVFPLYTTTQNVSLSDLFYVSSGNAKVKVKRNQVENSNNNYYQTLSRNASQYPDFNTTNLTNGVFGKNGGGTLATDLSYPTNGLSTLTYKITGGLDVWASVPYNGDSKLSVAGWMNRSSSNYTLQVRYYDIEGNLIQTDTVGISGTIGSWQKFGQQLTPPKNTYKVRLQLMGSSTAQTGDSCYINDWIIEQI